MSTVSDTKNTVIGKPLDRVDGRLKVTGQARYSAEYPVANLAYGYVVQSTIARGTIKEIDTSAAEKLHGVAAVFTYKNKPMDLSKNGGGKRGPVLFLLQDNQIHFAGQIIGLVVADTLEVARHAASLVKVSYDAKPFETDLNKRIDKAKYIGGEGAEVRGDVTKALLASAVKIDATYTTPKESHNPMEPFATIASWNGDSLTLYESTQGVHQSRNTIADILGVSPKQVRVITQFVGGGFGCKLLVWPHAALAAMAAQKLKRPVKVVLARTQMYGPVGFRPATIQHIKLGSSKDGKLQAVSHESVNENCTFFDFVESVSDGARFLYACPNAYTSEKVAALDIGQPTWMRAPGHAPGSFALESAMDELAYALNLDPVELRVRNFAERDLDKNLPYSGNSLLECYKRGAETFGWHKRDPKPRSMKEGRLLVGWGMATALHSVWRNSASVNVELLDDGNALVQSGSQDIGTGTYTIMTQIAADKLSLPVGRVKFELGDSNFPAAPVSGGSTTSGSVGGAVAQACSAALDKLIQTARKDAKSPLFGAQVEDIDALDGVLSLKSDRSKSESYQSIVSRTSQKKIQIKLETELDKNQEKYSMNTFGAQFAEVKVDPDLGTIQVARFVGTYGAGRILNAKTARSQMLGGITFGMGMALMEHMLIDHRFGKILNADLAEYHVPVHHDIADIDVSFIEEEDPYVNVIGAKGVGELGITGVAAAIANAVYHATGKRVRDLPITLDKLL